MVERRSLTGGAGSFPANHHTLCEVVAQKKNVSSILSSHHFISLRRMRMELHHLNVRVPGSNPGGVVNSVVAQLVEQHDEFHRPLSSQNSQRPQPRGRA